MTSLPPALHPLHIFGSPMCHQTVRLLLPYTDPEPTFVALLKTQLEALFGTKVQIELRPWSGSPRRSRYRLSGDWHRPAEVHNALVLLFSSFTGELTDEG